MSDRTPFRVVVREVVNLFEDNSSASAGDENHDHHGDTFEMTARSRETSPRTIIGILCNKKKVSYIIYAHGKGSRLC